MKEYVIDDGNRVWTADELRSEIVRLRALLKTIEEEERNNYPYEQLKLF